MSLLSGKTARTIVRTSASTQCVWSQHQLAIMRRRLWHSHSPVLVTVNAFQADLALSEQLIELDARGQPSVKRVKRSTHQLQRPCARSVRIVRVESPWLRLCEPLVTAFDFKTEALLDHNVLIWRISANIYMTNIVIIVMWCGQL